MKKKSCLFVISGPSAVGKSSVVDALLQMDTSIGRVLTCTTREPRKSEHHGIDYLFMTRDNFLSEVDNGSFVEFSEVYGNYYGVRFSTIREKFDQKEDAILVINWEGFFKIKNAIKENVYGIFITPPSMKDLELRIKSRGEDSSEVVARRIQEAQKDMDQAKFYDFCFQNDEIEETARNILEKIDSIRRMN